LRENPFPRGKLIKKLKGKKSTFYRLRVDKYRVYYTIEGPDVVVLRVLSKKDADKFIKRL
jgi:mRNA-degrading endonuclease RelE of RelBE toxin-antitoxin system